MNNQYKYIFGPVNSWRLGVSLGIDPISQESKVCNLDCIYCQLGPTVVKTNQRKVFVPTEEIVNELKSFPAANPDYYTISSRGEPTLALNLGDVIRSVKEITGGKVAVITNCFLIPDERLQKELQAADYIEAKIDAFDAVTFKRINNPVEGMDFSAILDGLKRFRGIYKGVLAAQVMFTNENVGYADEIAASISKIGIDVVNINTPLRECNVFCVPKEVLFGLKKKFKDFATVRTVYDNPNTGSNPVDQEATKLRHGRELETRNIVRKIG